ncbi:unnamed protein product [Calicophoron daubneyi]|uniref:Arp2/3 complex 34 kDa subunit n=1 Tax=Calicophoron daubneyi TaxID=300641 RepID=A0AAV2T1H8_CALDB
MILLDAFNRAVEEVLINRFESFKQDPESKVKINHTIADFDGVTFHICDAGDKKRLLVSISLRFFDELKGHGVLEFLKKEYDDLLSTETESGYSVTLSIDLTKLPEDHAQLARRCALLKRNCLAAVFVKFFDIHAKGDPKALGSRAVIHYREDETLYVQALADRVTVIFSTMFKDPDDMLIGKLFMQEFCESRRRLDRAPQVLYSYRTPPAELKGTNALVNDSVAYITFVLYPRHLTAGSARQKTIDLIHTLRNYLHYHIKCTKAYIQMRMRAKTVEFLKVINRAHTQPSSVPVINVGTGPNLGSVFSSQLSRMESDSASSRASRV